MISSYRDKRPLYPDRNPRLRAIWITSEYHPRVGGLENLVAELVSGLSATIEIGLVTGLHQCPRSGQAVAHLGALNLGGSKTKAELRAVRTALRALCIAFGPDIIHLASGGLAVFAEDLADLAPIYCTVHCKDVTDPWQKAPGIDVDRAIAEGLALCHKVFCVSDYTRRQVLARSPEAKAETMTPGLVVPVEASGAIRSVLSAPRPVEPRIVTVGRVVDRKGHFLLLDALEKVRAPFHWDVAGGGALEGALRKRIERSPLRDRVHIHGAVDEDRLGALLRRADLFALTPFEIERDGHVDAEGFGLVYLEAAMHGKPSVGSTAGGCREAIRHGVTGFVADPHDTDAIASYIETLLLDRPLSQAMGIAAFERLAHDFRLEDRVAALRQSYLETAAARGRRPADAVAVGL